MPADHFRFHREHEHLAPAFGASGFGALAESLARFFGTPQYLIAQTGIVIIWIAVNALGLVHFDLYPFILLNLAFSTQAAYAAPLILLAETRQAERDKAMAEADAKHRESLNEQMLALLQQNTELTQQVKRLTEEIHGKIVTVTA
ncbi:MAG: DUF1003 domain-containing protein [Chloroflexota bacterium]